MRARRLERYLVFTGVWTPSRMDQTTRSLRQSDDLPLQIAEARGRARDWSARGAEPAPAIREAVPYFLPARDVVSRVQNSLSALGFDPGPVDGVVGAKTRGAIRSYQRSVGLGEDGRISDALIRRLEASAASGAD